MQAFDGLQDEFYPGSRLRRRESRAMKKERLDLERAEAKANESWDAHPKGWVHPQTKQDLELFNIGALAKALGRDSVTIRTWIRKGWLPRAKYQTRPLVGTPGNAGRRLWTREQIEGIVAIAKEEGLLGDPPARLQRTRFTQRVIAAWKEWQ
jgi:hypothetical protein